MENNPGKIYLIDRQTGEKKEELIYFGSILRFLYGSLLGKILGKCISIVPFFSHFSGWWQRRSLTRRHIAPFINKYCLNSTEFEKKPEEYASFDAFFTRKLKKEARPLADGVILPADGRYLVYQNVATCDGFVVKGKKFSLKKLLGNPKLAQHYAEGSMTIARLAPCDYHRFHFPANCTPSPAQLINGPLYSVNPIAVKKNVELLTENKRMVTHLHTQDHGTILFIEIGATNVGTIHQTFIAERPYKKGDEKGFFSFGGSCIILLFEPGKIQFSKDLLTNSLQHFETLCHFGQSLEEKK